MKSTQSNIATRLQDIYDYMESLIFSGYSFSLSDKIGLTILYAHKYYESETDYHFSIYEKVLTELIDTVKFDNSSLISGAAGVLWTLKHLNKLDLLEFNLEKIINIERQVSCEYKISLSKHNWGYYHGSIGHLLALQNSEYYERFLYYLSHNIKKNSWGTYSLLSSLYSVSSNLGYHAGILGVLSFLNFLIGQDVSPRKCMAIQDRLLDIIFSKLEDTKQEYYPSLYENNFPCRMCWTYGELSLAHTLLNVGLTRTDMSLVDKASFWMDKSVKTDSLDKANIIDSCLICGAAGNFLLYKLINKGKHLKKYLHSERIWKRYTYEILQKHNFHNINRYDGSEVVDLSILHGLSGICLALENFENDSWLDYLLFRSNQY